MSENPAREKTAPVVRSNFLPAIIATTATGNKMSLGALSNYFFAFAWKSVTAVEVDPEISNGHEFNPLKPTSARFWERDKSKYQGWEQHSHSFLLL